jgi:hypothetical protein
MLTEEDYDWYELHPLFGKNGRDDICHARSWKLYLDRWDFDDSGSNKYKSDYNCWKRHRKTHYRIKKVHTDKKRRSKEKEHWRSKKDHHTYDHINNIWRHNEKIRIAKDKISKKEVLKFMNNVFNGSILLDSKRGYRRDRFALKVVDRYYKDDGELVFVVQKFLIMDLWEVYLTRYPSMKKEIGKQYIVNSHYFESKKLDMKVYRLDEVYSMG